MRLYQCRYCQRDTTALQRNECAACARVMRGAVSIGGGLRSERQRLYNTAEWKRGRRYHLNNKPLCAACGKPASVVDHITPHRGELALFWNPENWQSLCTTCHNSKTRGGQ